MDTRAAGANPQSQLLYVRRGVADTVDAGRPRICKPDKPAQCIIIDESTVQDRTKYQVPRHCPRPTVPVLLSPPLGCAKNREIDEAAGPACRSLIGG